MLKKILISLFVLSLVAANFLLAAPANASSIHDSPWCGLVFWRDGYCDDGDDDAPAPAPAPAPANQAPVFTTGQTAFNIKGGENLQFTISAIDPNNDPISYGVSFLPIGSNFNAITKTFSWTPTASQLGTYLVQFSAFDGKTYAYQGISINVTEASTTSTSNNHKPVWTPAADKTVTANQTVQFSVLATDPDGDTVHYTLLNWPAGGNFHAASRTFSWTPNSNQVGTHVVSFRASDEKDYNDMGVIVIVTAGASTPTPTPNPQPNPSPAPVKMKISDIKFANDDGEIIISWETNIPAKSRVIYDTESQTDRTANFTYKNATPDGTVMETKHSVNLGKLKVGTVYYLRAVSKNNGQTATSQEIALVQLEDGGFNTLFGASLFEILGELFKNSSFLWIVIMILASSLFILYRRIQKLSSPL